MIRILLFTTVLFLLIIHTTLAQTEKGGKLLGASVYLSLDDEESESFTSPSYAESEGFSVGLYPYMGFFIKDGLALGGELILHTGHDRESSDNGYDRAGTSQSHSYQVGASVFVKRMKPIKGQLGWYLRPALGYDIQWVNTESEATFTSTSDQEENREQYTDLDQHTFALSATAGLYYFLGDRWSIEAELLSATLSYELQKRFSMDRNSRYPGIRPSYYETQNLRLHSNLTNRFSLSQTFTINYYF